MHRQLVAGHTLADTGEKLARASLYRKQHLKNRQ